MNFKDIKFQYYRNDVKSIIPSGYISLDRFINAIRKPKQDVIDLLHKIEIAAKENDLKLKAELKKGLYAFTPDVIIKDNCSRKYDNVESFTGIAVLDFDKIENPDIFKKLLFDEYKEIICAWLSPSKKGVKALIRIPIVKTKAEFKEYTYGISAIMQRYKGFDIVVNNAVLVLFIGSDANILVRQDPDVWTRKGKKLNDFDSAPIKEFKSNQEITNKMTEWVINWYSDKINAIFTDGHPQLRDCSVALGGYVGSGYISNYDAINLSESLITSNSYLRKGISGYQKTARQAINIGIKKPLTFDN